MNPFRYRSYYYDSDIEMYYLLSRYYDLEIGRFINCDDVNYIGLEGSVISYNPFAYCENNPINYVDYTGFSKGVTPFQLLSLLKQFKQVASNLIAILIKNNR